MAKCDPDEKAIPLFSRWHKVESVYMGLGAVSEPDLMEWHSLCHTFRTVVFCLEHGGTHHGYPFNFGCRGIIFRNFRVRTKVEYGGDTEGPELFHT